MCTLDGSLRLFPASSDATASTVIPSELYLHCYMIIQRFRIVLMLLDYESAPIVKQYSLSPCRDAA